MRPKLHQVKALVEFMEQHPELARGRLRGPLGRRRSIDLWTEVAGRLNAMGGAFKEPRVWSKYWADKKTWLKMAAAKRLRAAMQTGEDDSSVPTLTETDKKILNVLGEGFVPEPEVESAPVSPAEGYMEIKVEEGVMDHEAPCTSSHQQPQGQPRQRLRTNLAREKAELVAIEKKRVDAERVTADALSRMANAFEIFVNNSERQTAILLTLAERQIDVLQTLTEALKPNAAGSRQQAAGSRPQAAGRRVGGTLLRQRQSAWSMRSALCCAARLPRLAPREFFNTMASDAMAKPQTATTTIKEGQAEIVLASDKVFYNPVQEFNRDLSIAVLKIFSEEYKRQAAERASAKNRGQNVESSGSNGNKEVEFSILEALSATGLRSIRYAKEIPSITKIVANDLSQQAVQTIQANIVHNHVEHLVETSHDDASMLMYKHRRYQERFCAIDLDPYGCPSGFLDGAVQSVRDGGLLLVTATDMAVLAGNSPETCYSKYGAISLKTKSCHEMALRILLQCIEQHATRHSRYIVPLLSISADFYVRVFVKIYSGAVHCKKTTSKLSMVYHCVGCDHITLQPLGGFKPNPTEKNPSQMKAYLPTGPPVSQNCVHCNEKHHMGGPIWSGPLHDQSFVQRLIMHVEDNHHLFNTSSRIQGILSMVLEELVDVPLYYTIDKLFSRAHLETMPMLVFRSAILNAGYKVSYSHAAKNSIKTNAPGHVVWDILRVWEKSHPVKPERLESDQTAKFILSQEVSSTVDFSLRPDANPCSRRDGRLRFQFNPTPHWGPGTRASARVGEEKLLKSVQNQNKTSGRVSSKELKQLKRQHSPHSNQDTCKKTNTESLAEPL